jgi:hypothetical protein
MKRREFIAGLGSVAAWPVVGWAQQPAKLPTIGCVRTGFTDSRKSRRARREPT